MKATKHIKLISLILPLASLLTVIPSQGAQGEVLRRDDVMVESVTATVTAIDYETRALSLKFDDGLVEQFVAGPEVKRLGEVAVGDTVAIDYVTALGMELRPPTAEEAADPFVILEGGARAPTSAAPAGAIGRTIRAVATVEVLDRIHNTATLVGPMGNALTIRVKDPSRLTQARIGDTVLVTYTEAVVVSLEKVKKAGK